MANYIDPDHYDRVMFDCKIKGELSPEALRLFELQAKEVSKKDGIIFKYEDDRNDAIQYALCDFVSYWKGYRINPICQIVMLRNFLDGEKITVHIGDKTFVYNAKTFVNGDRDFKIHNESDQTKSINKTLEGLNELINSENTELISSYLHKVTKKINIVDYTCYKDSINYVVLEKIVGNQLSKNDFGKTSGQALLKFDNPPPAFNYMTSLARNGILKGLKKMYPKSSRIITNFSDINRDNGGLFNQ